MEKYRIKLKSLGFFDASNAEVKYLNKQASGIVLTPEVYLYSVVRIKDYLSLTFKNQ